jgi:hypothetical protein
MEQTMRLGTARSLIVFGSMVSIVLFVSGLYVGAATTRYPIDISQIGGLLKICLPTFFGYLGAAAHYIFRGGRRNDARRVPLLGTLLIGSFLVFYSICLSGIFAYYIINSPTLPGAKLNPNEMGVGDLETVLTLGMSFLSLTTNVIASYIFSKEV